MAINKWLIIGSMTVVVLGLAMIIMPGGNRVLEGIGISLLSSAIVSIVTSSLYCAYERRDEIKVAKESLDNIYVNLVVIKKVLGKISPLVFKIDELSKLNYRRLTELASQALELALNCKTDGIAGKVRRGRPENKLQRYKRFVSEIANLKSCLLNAELLATVADHYALELAIKQLRGCMITPTESSTLFDKKNLVNVKTAKIHEYTASLILQLDDLANAFYASKKEPWEQRKQALGRSVEAIMAQIDYLDSL